MEFLDQRETLPYLELRKPIRGLIKANAPITNECLVRLKDRMQRWPIFVNEGTYRNMVLI